MTGGTSLTGPVKTWWLWMRVSAAIVGQMSAVTNVECGVLAGGEREALGGGGAEGGGGGGTARGYSWPAVDLLKVRAQELCERQGGPGFQSIIVLVITFQFLILKQRVVFGDLPLFYIIFYFIILAAGMILIPAEHPLILQHVTGQQKHKQILSHWWQFCLQASEDWDSSQ